MYSFVLLVDKEGWVYLFRRYCREEISGFNSVMFRFTIDQNVTESEGLTLFLGRLYIRFTKQEREQ
jgi:hypothetical protein